MHRLHLLKGQQQYTLYHYLVYGLDYSVSWGLLVVMLRNIS
jgi:hypothetical protein